MNFRLFYSQHRLLVSLIAFSLLCLAAVVSSTLFSRPTHANNQRVITIYNGQSTTTVTTTAASVAEVLKRASIDLDAKDVVEPGLDTELTAPSYAINIYRVRPVTVVDGNSKRIVMSAYQSPRTIVKQADIELYDEDIVTASRPAEVLSSVGDRLDIDRATVLSMTLYGKQVTVRTQSATVKDLLKEKGITLQADDQLSIADSATIADGMSVEVWRNGVQTVTQELEVAFDTENIQNADQPLGFREVKTAGVNGKRLVTYEIDMRNGQELNRKEIQSVVTVQPIKQVEVIGAKLPTPTNPTENQAIGHQMMLAAGFGEDQWPCLYNLWMRESGWRTTAGNTSSGAYGIPQSLPASKMASYGADYLTNPVPQISWGLNYIKGRYQTPCGAWTSFQAKGWY